MVRDLHADLKTAKNILNTDEAWLVLFDLYVSDTEVLRLTNNEVGVIFAGDTYSPFPVGFEAFEETSTGDLPYLNIVVGNVDRMISGYLESHGGLLDRKVIMKIVHESNLSTSTAVIESSLMIRETSVSETSVTFRLSHHPFFEVDLPHQRFYRHRCRFAFKSGECGWDQAESSTTSSSCDKTLDGPNGCKAHGDLYDIPANREHPDRFGGFPGIPRRRI
jgi:lambda family phage minor tail protein L